MKPKKRVFSVMIVPPFAGTPSEFQFMRDDGTTAKNRESERTYKKVTSSSGYRLWTLLESYVKRGKWKMATFMCSRNGVWVHYYDADWYIE